MRIDDVADDTFQALPPIPRCAARGAPLQSYHYLSGPLQSYHYFSGYPVLTPARALHPPPAGYPAPPAGAAYASQEPPLGSAPPPPRAPHPPHPPPHPNPPRPPRRLP